MHRVMNRNHSPVLELGNVVNRAMLAVMLQHVSTSRLDGCTPDTQLHVQFIQ